MELIGVLCALSPIALVGLFIYTLVRLQRSRSKPAGQSHSAILSLCPRCRSPKSGEQCTICNWPGIPVPQSTRRALEALRQRVGSLTHAGLLPQETHDQLMSSISAELARFDAAQPVANPVVPAVPETVGLSPKPLGVVQAEVIDEAAPPLMVASSPPPADTTLRPADAPLPRSPLAAAEQVASDRVRRYREGVVAQQTAPVTVPVAAPEVPSAPKARLADLLATFMEEKNVRWGELVGGMLIVGCSIALVISFWSQIAARPFLKFGLFNGIVAALFALGFYTDKKWKLPTTSRAVLIIAALLVPLNFLSIAAVTRDGVANSPLVIAGEIVSILLFSGLVYGAGRTITPQVPMALAVGVLGSSIAQLSIRRWVHADLPDLTLFTLAAWPLVCHALATGANIFRLRRSEILDEPKVHALFRVLGLTAFAALTACGLLLSLSGQPAVTLGRLAPLVSLAGAPAMAAGLLLWRRLRESELTGLRTAGTAIAVLGSAIMLGGIALAWPDPALLVAVAAINFVVLSLVAIAYQLPAAHLLAGVAVSVGTLITLHVLRGDLAWRDGSTTTTLRALCSAVSGNALVGLAVIYALAALGWRWLGRQWDALYYFISAALIGVASLVLVTVFGFRTIGDPNGATWTYTLYTFGALAGSIAVARAESQLSARLQRLPSLLAWSAAALAALALVQGMVYRPVPPAGLISPWSSTAIAYGLAMLVATLMVRLPGLQCGPVAKTLERAALAASLVAALLIARDTFGWGVPRVDPFVCGMHAALLSVLWFSLAYVRASAVLFSAGQAALFAAATLGGIVLTSRQDWWWTATRVWPDPRLWQNLGCIGAVLCIAWTLLRTAVDRWSLRNSNQESTRGSQQLRLTQRFLNPGWTPIDHTVTVYLVLALVAVASYAAWPGVAQELSLESAVTALAQRSPQLVTPVGAHRLVPATVAFETAGVPHAPAFDRATWLWLALAAGLLIVGCWERVTGWRILSLLMVGATVCPLLAARYESEVAVASALRWLSSGYFLVGSIFFWSRDRLAAIATKLGVRDLPATSGRLTNSSVGALAALAATPLVAMTAVVAYGALGQVVLDAPTRELMSALAVLFALATAFAAMLVIAGRTSQRAIDAGQAGWREWASSASAIILVLGAAPLIASSIYVIAAHLAGDPIVGPDAASIFVRMGLAPNYSLPAALVALVLVGYAIRERSATFAFLAGLVTNLTATVAYLFTAGSNLTPHDPLLWVELGMLNALVAALFGLAWQTVTWWWTRKIVDREPIAQLQVAQAALAVSLVVLVLGAATAVLWIDPHPPEGWLTAVSEPLGIAACVAALGLSLWLSAGRSRVATTALAATSLWSVGTLLGTAAVHWDTGNWLAIHVLLATRIAGPWLMVAGGWWWYRREVLAYDEPPRRAVTIWTSLLVVPLLLTSLRLVGTTDLQEPWWSTLGVKSAALVAMFLAIWSCRRTFLYVASALLVLAMAVWFPRSYFWPSAATADGEVYAFIDALLVALVLPVVAWLVIELRWIRPQLELLGRHGGLPVHRPATWCAILTLGLVTCIGVVADYGGATLSTSSLYEAAAVGAIAIAALACLWDARAREAVAMLYLFGLVLVGVFLDSLNLAGDRLLWTGTIALGAFTLATSYLWSRRRGLQSLAQQLRMPIPVETSTDGALWIRSFTTLLVVTTVALVFWVQVACPDQELRISAGFAAMFQAFALAMLAEGSRRANLQRDALLVGMLGAIAFSWAFVPPEVALPILNRSVATSVALLVTTIVYALGLARLPLRLSDWVGAAERFAPVAVFGLLVSVAAVLGQEVSYYLRDGAVPLGLPAVLAIVATLLTLFAAALVAALLPGRDPLGLTERGRMAYVYAAEGVLALVFLHVRVTMPWLFQGVFLAWWPLVVMAIAYLGVGLAEFFGRRENKVLAQPLERTGILLPLLPVIGFWFVDSQTNYSLLLLVVGGLYAALAVTRKSMGFGLLAALAANGGLWHYLHKLGGVGLLEHPQLWLIPPALCVLAAAYLNRDRLSAAQMTTVRYITSMTIYLSSTADIFIQGVEQAPWLPLVLAAFALAGVFAGIMLRVRAFLFLGTGFLTLAILTMIWHAGSEFGQFRIWSVTGIAAGIGVIVMFALFEKRRQDVLRVVDQLKQWEG